VNRHSLPVGSSTWLLMARAWRVRAICQPHDPTAARHYNRIALRYARLCVWARRAEQQSPFADQ
jgi:hypothetical protein